ncbi:MAG: CapA family protein, partial [Pseudonocardia sp.]|nr:CapA family protein [Pseudonocardia sp.]
CISATAPPTSFTLVATGDVLVLQEGALVRGAAAAGRANGTGFDFSPVLARVAPVIQGADLAICHLETPLAPPGGPFRGYPLFDVQPQIVDALVGAGYDTCSTASNHALDRGYDGLARTLDALDVRGMGHTGTFRTREESQPPWITEVNGVRVGHISWTYGLNGLARPAGKPWSVNVFDANAADAKGILADARRVRTAGAEVVVVSVHCCVEYTVAPTPVQVKIAETLLASPDVDLVLGHHAHVVQPMERIGGKWVVYGLGNHIAEQRAGATEDSVIVRFTFTRGPDGAFAVSLAEAIPTRIEFGGGAVTVVNSAARRGPYTASYDRIVTALTSRGAAAAGLKITDR